MALNLGRINLSEEGLPARFALNWLTLKFRDRKVEKSYAYNDIKNALPLIRLSLFLAALLYASFGFLDYHLAEDALGNVWFIRFGIVSPIILFVVAASFTRVFRRIAQFFLSLTMIAAGAGIVAMTAITDAPANTYYYAGLIMVVIYGSTLVRLQFIYSALISLALVASYQWVAISLNPIPPTSLLNNNFFLFMATAVGIFASYIQELYVRLNHVSTRLLIEEKGKSEQLLAKSEAANNAKSEFLAIVSHELRTPLNAIIGFSEFLKLEMFGPLGSDRYRGYSNDIYRSGQHLLHIINDILDLSRAEANKLEISEEKFNLAEMVHGCLRMIRNKTAVEGVRISHKISEDINVLADQRLMNQVVINLLSNAIKFTSTGGAITVETSCDENDCCSVTVSDTGIGIAHENLAKIFEPFMQVESAKVRTQDGLGLGLPLVKRIMDLHGGKVNIESTLGKGTTVTVTMPGWRRAEWDEGKGKAEETDGRNEIAVR